MTFPNFGNRALRVSILTLCGVVFVSLPATIRAQSVTSHRSQAKKFFSAFTSTSTLSFLSPLPLDSNGLASSSVAVTDLNHDGNVDLVFAGPCIAGPICTTSNGEVSVLLGNGDGTFQNARIYDSGGQDTMYVVVGDMNGDGKPDLITANAAGSVSVLLGVGDGTFQPAVTYTTGTGQPMSVAVGDLNGDGKLDVVVALWQGAVGVFLGSGNGVLQSMVTYDCGPDTTSVVLADVNGDSKLDVLVGGGNAVDVLLGKGDGTLQPSVGYPSTPVALSQVIAVDVNADDKLDLITVSQGGGRGGVVGVIVARRRDQAAE